MKKEANRLFFDQNSEQMPRENHKIFIFAGK
jgi:hypothetical protein